MLEEEARKVRAGRAALRLMPVPLYAGLPAAAQLAAFEHAPRGYRKACALHGSVIVPCLPPILHLRIFSCNR